MWTLVDLQCCTLSGNSLASWKLAVMGRLELVRVAAADLQHLAVARSVLQPLEPCGVARQHLATWSGLTSALGCF